MIKWIMLCVRSAAFSVFVNGERHGYFKGGRGLRQGDPMSPYIFTLVMEVFTHSMKKQISKALDSFNAVSGLVPSLGKSTIFFGNVEESIKNEILEIMPFKIGKLPVSYLGVPLITKQIGINECKCLIDKVKIKVNNWKNRMLYYAGRLQLVASVLTSMQVYWASVFILPKTVIKDIDRLLKGFLWCQGDLSKGKAKVAWKQICRPKNEKGLGIKNLCDWNEVLMDKHLWNLDSNKESLWVKWINVIRLKGKCIWEAKYSTNSSSGWKQLLSLRDKMKKHVKYEVGNGKTIFLWHDKWWDGGILKDVFPIENLPNVDSSIKISEMIQNLLDD
nr:RNA-directed DNA polymerase, eukaryota, reverse transcriptase zinc-binding domain protein [Tanacetum cinerariifolium]